MITADIPELQQISDVLCRCSSEIDDITGKTMVTLKEMSSDTELLGYPQAQSCLEKINEAETILFGVNEEIRELGSIMLAVPDGYADMERDLKNRLSAMTSYLSILSAGYTEMPPSGDDGKEEKAEKQHAAADLGGEPDGQTDSDSDR